MKIVLMTSDHPRHIMFIGEIHKKHNVEAVFFESKPPFKESKYKKEIKFFSDEKYLLSDLETFNVEKGEINSSHVIENLKSINPDCVS